jgi:hypothetical protein
VTICRTNPCHSRLRQHIDIPIVAIAISVSHGSKIAAIVGAVVTDAVERVAILVRPINQWSLTIRIQANAREEIGDEFVEYGGLTIVSGGEKPDCQFRFD